MMTIIITFMAVVGVFSMLGLYELSDRIVLGKYYLDNEYEYIVMKLNKKCFYGENMIHWGYYDFASPIHGIFASWVICDNGENKRVRKGSRIEILLNDKMKVLRELSQASI